MAALIYISPSGKKRITSLGSDIDKARDAWKKTCNNEALFRRTQVGEKLCRTWYENENEFNIEFVVDFTTYLETYVFDENNNDIYG